jgi:hypothetical protein
MKNTTTVQKATGLTFVYAFILLTWFVVLFSTCNSANIQVWSILSSSNMDSLKVLLSRAVSPVLDESSLCIQKNVNFLSLVSYNRPNRE